MELKKKKQARLVQKAERLDHAHHWHLLLFFFFFDCTQRFCLPIEKEAFRTGCDVTLSSLRRHHSNVQKVSLQFPVSGWGIPAAQRDVLQKAGGLRR